MNAYSIDLRERIVEAVEGGMSRARAVETYRVSLATIKRYLKLKRQGGGLDPKPSPGRRPKIRSEQHAELEEQLRAHDTAKLEEHIELWRKKHGVGMSVPAMSRAIKRVGWTRKKGVWVPVSVTRGSERTTGSG